MCKLSRELQRQVGVLCNRRGDIEHVFVGDSSKLMLPDFGRLRAGRGRFRGLRLIHTHLRNEVLTRDDLVDLALLRLDLVAALGVGNDGNPADLHLAHLLPSGKGTTPWQILPSEPFYRSKINFEELIESLEREFDRVVPKGQANAKQDRAVLVIVETTRKANRDASSMTIDQRQAELEELCRTAGVACKGVITQRRPEADPKYLVGRGKLEDVLVRGMQEDATLLIFDPELTPNQAQAIGEFTDIKVIDRTMLILDIFARRAKSRDGKLQVELAQLKYMLPRLQDKDTMMSRLTGGIGGRGPGETKLEINRRRARERIHGLEKELEKYGEQRVARRQVRTERGLPVVAIVGYTNAGKSTLLNSLTRSDVLVEDKLFATLDPTTRRLRFPKEREIIIADTVGFIRDLPLDLAKAFRATLEELAEADLLLHVVDASDEKRDQQIAAVERILTDLGYGETPRMMVYNKMDRLSPQETDVVNAMAGVIGISAVQPQTARPLLEEIENKLWSGILATPN